MSRGYQEFQTCSGARPRSIGPALGMGLPIADRVPFGTARLALAIAGALTAAACLMALAVHVGFAAPVRHWLAFPFAGFPADANVTAMIFLHNLRALSAVGGLLLIAQSPHWTTRTAGAAQRALQRVGEVLLAGAVGANVLAVGASLGAYGMRMVRAVLPQGPVELAAYSLMLALYVEGRRRQVALAHMAAIAMLSGLTLALAAVLETFVTV